MSWRVPILTYHSVDDSGSVVSTAAAELRRRVAELAAAGAVGVPVGELLETLLAGRALPPRAVAIAFDDGYRNVAEHGLPALREHGFRATVFAVSGRIGGDSGWPGQPAGVPRLPLLDWDDLRRLRDAGWEIGAHGESHVSLAGLDRERLRREVEASRRRLADELGVRITLFAYPYGEVDGPARQAVERSFRGACGTRLDHVAPGFDRYELPRIDAYYLRDRALPAWLWSRRGRLYLGLRRLGRTLRAAAVGALHPG